MISKSAQTISQQIRQELPTDKDDPNLSILIDGIAQLWDRDSALARQMEKALLAYVATTDNPSANPSCKNSYPLENLRWQHGLFQFSLSLPTSNSIIQQRLIGMLYCYDRFQIDQNLIKLEVGQPIDTGKPNTPVQKDLSPETTEYPIPITNHTLKIWKLSKTKRECAFVWHVADLIEGKLCLETLDGYDQWLVQEGLKLSPDDAATLIYKTHRTDLWKEWISEQGYRIRDIPYDLLTKQSYFEVYRHYHQEEPGQICY